MKAPSPPEFQELFDRILAGELTRKQAAELAHQQTGRSPSTFLSWITVSKERKSLLYPLRLTVGVNNVHAHKDPDKVEAYRNAVELALSNRVSVRSAANKFGVDYRYLLVKVRKARGDRPKTLSIRKAEEATVAALEAALNPSNPSNPTNPAP